MKIVLYAKAPDATKHYRLEIPGRYLVKAGHEVKLEYAERLPKIPAIKGVQKEDLEWADVILFQRPVTPKVMEIISYIRKNFPKKPILADYDDDYYNVPRWNPGYPHLKMHEDSWKAIAEKFDGIITSTEPLKDVMAKEIKNPDTVFKVIGNGFDFESFDEIEPMQQSVSFLAPDPSSLEQLRTMYTIDTQQFNEIAKDRTIFVWAGSKFHYHDLDWIPESIGKICKERDDIVFLFIGYLQGNIVIKSQVNRLYTAKGVAPTPNFYSFLKSIAIDCMMAPLDPNQFNRSKSNLKTMEAMALGAYPVCSRWDAYEIDLDPLDDNMDNVHGTLVGYQPYAWAKAIMDAADKLKDKDFKKRYKAENDAYMRTTHAAELRTPLYVDFFQEMIDRKSQ